MKLGATAVQLGTRFVTTEECDASENFKDEYVQAKEDNIQIIQSPVGMPGRAIKNEYIEQVNKGDKKPFACPYHCIKTCDYKDTPYCISLALINAQKGNLKHGFAFAGTNAYRANKIIKVSELTNKLKQEYQKAKESDI